MGKEGLDVYKRQGERHRVNWDLLATYVARAVALLTAIPVHESALSLIHI